VTVLRQLDDGDITEETAIPVGPDSAAFFRQNVSHSTNCTNLFTMNYTLDSLSPWLSAACRVVVNWWDGDECVNYVVGWVLKGSVQTADAPHVQHTFASIFYQALLLLL
jgi:hypothetical protein